MRPLLHRADMALWKLPRWSRKAVIAPVVIGSGVAMGLAAAWREFRYEFRDVWRVGMEHVELRPDEQPPDPMDIRSSQDDA